MWDADRPATISDKTGTPFTIQDRRSVGGGLH